MGRPPKPAALKRLQGTERPDRAHNEVCPPGKMPTRPKWLLPEAKRAWTRLAAPMVSLGLLSAVDFMAFAMLCQSWARYQRAERKRTEMETADTSPVDLRRQDLICNKRLQEVSMLMGRFGLSPSDRARLSLVEVQAEDLEAALHRLGAKYRDLDTTEEKKP